MEAYEKKYQSSAYQLERPPAPLISEDVNLVWGDIRLSKIKDQISCLQSTSHNKMEISPIFNLCFLHHIMFNSLLLPVLSAFVFIIVNATLAAKNYNYYQT